MIFNKSLRIFLSSCLIGIPTIAQISQPISVFSNSGQIYENQGNIPKMFATLGQPIISGPMELSNENLEGFWHHLPIVGQTTGPEIVFGNNGSASYFIQSFSPPQVNIGPTGPSNPNPDLNLVLGQRYRVIVPNFTIHPFEIIGISAPVDFTVLTMEPSANQGVAELIPDVNWNDNGAGTIEFTLTNSLVALLTTLGSTAGYRSGGSTSTMRGNIIVDRSGGNEGESGYRVDFDFVGLHELDQGINSFTASSQTVFPFWFLEANHLEEGFGGAISSLDTITLTVPYEFDEICLPPDSSDTAGPFVYSYENVSVAPGENISYLGSQNSVSETELIALNVTRAAIVDGSSNPIPITLTGTHDVEIIASVTPTDSNWSELGVSLLFIGATPVAKRTSCRISSIDQFADLELLPDPSAEAPFSEIDRNEDSLITSLDWEATEGIQASQTYQFRAKVRFALKDNVQSATIEPSLIVSGVRSEDQNTETWVDKKLTLPSPHNGSITILGEAPTETDTNLRSFGVDFSNKTTQIFNVDTFSISGTIGNITTKEAPIIVSATLNSSTDTTLKFITLENPGSYSIPELPPGDYNISAFIDTDGNGIFSIGEEIKSYPNGSQLPLAVTIGPNATDIDITFDTLEFGKVNLSNNTGQSRAGDMVASGGEVYLVWSDNSGGNFDTLFVRSENGGTTFLPPINISNNEGDTVSHIDLAVVEDLVYIVWRDNSPGNDESFFSVSGDGGQTFSDPSNLSNHPGFQDFPRIAASGSNVYVTWFGAPGSDVFFTVSNNNGTSFSTPINLSMTPGLSFNQVMMASGNDIHVIWRDESQGAAEVFYISSDDSGSNFGDAVNLSNNSGESANLTFAISDSNVYVVWGDNTPGNFDFFLSKSDNGGDTFSDPINVSNNAGDSSILSPEKYVAAVGNNLYLVWGDSTPGNQDIFFRRSEDNGDSFSDPINLSD